MVLKRRLFILLSMMLILACPGRAEVSDYVRLHVVAADDTAAAQALKLEVRDAVLSCARGLLKDAGDADDAWKIINENVDTLEAVARERAADAVCQTGVFDFPDRRYGDTLVPAGAYRALRVVIGPGAGRNWWCVLYPSLCYPEEWRTEDGRLYSSVWRWLQSTFGGEGP